MVTLPLTTTESAGTWSPWARRMRSSTTSSAEHTSTRTPSRMTDTGRCVRIVSLSTIRFARISWKTPMAMFERTTPMKSAFLHCWVMATSTNMARFTALKNVNVWSARMRPTDLVLTSVSEFTRPSARRSATSAELNPTRPSSMTRVSVVSSAMRAIVRHGPAQTGPAGDASATPTYPDQ